VLVGEGVIEPVSVCDSDAVGVGAAEADAETDPLSLALPPASEGELEGESDIVALDAPLGLAL